MSVAGHSPPPFFRRGPAPLAQLAFFVLLSIALIVADVKLNALSQVRAVGGVALSPMQQLLAMPSRMTQRIGEYLSRLTTVLAENRELQQQRMVSAADLLRQRFLEDENRRLRALLDLRDRVGVTGRVATVLFASRDPFSRHVIIDKGVQDGIRAGNAVIDSDGVIGQVVRADPLTAEVALLTDSNQAIPVRIARNGLRAVLFGVGDGRLELRYLAANADVQADDLIETSGLDGVYLSGLPVARVVGRDGGGDFAFARVVCKPVAGIDAQGMVMVLDQPPAEPPRPAGFEPITARSAERPRGEATRSTGRRP